MSTLAAPEISHVADLLVPSIDDLGFRLVQLRLLGRGAQRTLQVLVEPVEIREMTVEDCAEVSRTVAAILDVEDPLSGAYLLEVSSPGVDRPLVRFEDFVRFEGHTARIELRRMVAGQRRFRGRILTAENGKIRVAISSEAGGEKIVELPYSEVEKAKLTTDDAAIANSMKRRKQAR